MFAGLGGFHLGLARLGHRCVLSCESNERLRDLYERNFGLRPHHDIRKLRSDRVPEHEVLCAGFPCQPFSKAGEQLGLACKKDGDLFQHLLRIIKYRRPNFLLLENVANLERHDEGRTYRRMRKQLEHLGYTVTQQVLSPHKFGIPQVRERLFIAASLTGLGEYEWATGNGRTPTIWDVLDDSPPEARPIPEHYRRCLAAWQEFLDLFPQDEKLPSFPIWSMEFGADYPYEAATPARLGSVALARHRGSHGLPLRELPPEERMGGLPSYARKPTFPAWKRQFIRQNRELHARHRGWLDSWIPRILEFPPSLQKLEWNCKGERRRLSDHILQFRASGVRVKRATTAPALIAMTTTQVPIIAAQGRYMTVRECSRLQGMGNLKHLPEAPTVAYRALGNAVNADLVELVAAKLLAPILDQRPPDCPGRRLSSTSAV
jgi:DNA (cytosine-5)-methyltransferase 1